jgi:hypothetical protein
LVLGTVAVLIGLALLVGLSVAAGHGKVDVSNLGDREFWAGNADRLAARIAKDGRPFLFSDVSDNRKRDLYLQHLGPSDATGWLAISAGPRGCSLVWTGAGFRDPCSSATYPPDGAGLVHYRTRVDGNAVYIDLRTEVP